MSGAWGFAWGDAWGISWGGEEEVAVPGRQQTPNPALLTQQQHILRTIQARIEARERRRLEEPREIEPREPTAPEETIAAAPASAEFVSTRQTEARLAALLRAPDEREADLAFFELAAAESAALSALITRRLAELDLALAAARLLTAQAEASKALARARMNARRVAILTALFAAQS